MKRSQSLPGSKMNKETWSNLSEDTKKIWDKIPDKEKRSILQYAHNRAMKREGNIAEQGKALEANVLEQAEPDSGETTKAENETGEEEKDPGMLEVHNAIAKARGEAHPSDIRKMMGNRPKAAASGRKAMTVRFYPDSSDEEDSHLLDDYADSDEDLSDYPGLTERDDSSSSDGSDAPGSESWGGYDSDSDEDF